MKLTAFSFRRKCSLLVYIQGDWCFKKYEWIKKIMIDESKRMSFLLVKNNRFYLFIFLNSLLPSNVTNKSPIIILKWKTII